MSVVELPQDLNSADCADGAARAHHGEALETKRVPLKVLPNRAATGVSFLDLTFDTLPLDEAARLVMERSARPLPFVYVATPNVDHRVRLKQEPGLKSIYEQAWMTLCDSRIIELLARLDGIRLRAAPGADLVEYLFEKNIKPDDAVNVIGSSEDVIDTLKSRYNLTNLRWHKAPMELRKRPEAISEAAAFVANNPARLTFICVGSPQQELVARAVIERGDAKGVGLCCGASLDFLTGKVSRAPRWMRNIALEWLHRLATNPVRFGHRYLVDGPAIFPIWLKSRQRTPGADGSDHGTALPSRSADAVGAHPAT